MSHAYARNYIHLVFSTRERRKLIRADFQPKLWAYLRGIARNYNLDLFAIGGMDDHVHLLFSIPPKLSLADAIRALKANSSKWANESGHVFSWQDGYGAFSVSSSNVAAVTAYINAQAEHHQTRSFEQEFAAILKKHGVEFVPEQVFG